MKPAAPKARLAAAFAAALLASCGPSAPSATEHSLDHDGVARSYLVYAPAAHPARPALLLVLHGWQGSAAAMESRTNFRFDRLADRDGFIVAYPDALAGQWHSGHDGEVATSDDVGFLSTLIDTLARTWNVDPARIYVTGYSNGASMTYRLACERPDRIAAIAPVSGGLAVGLMRACAARSGRPIPLALIHGTADPEVPFTMGELTGNLSYWIRRNGCTQRPATSYLPDADPGDGTRTRIERATGCREGADVILYAVEGGGHHWPGGDEPARGKDMGNVARDFDGADLVWDFLRAHPRQ